MSHSLQFAHRHLYEFSKHITVPVTLLSSRSRWADAIVAVDTGSTFCIFDRTYGETLGLDIESGLEQRITTATGSFYCYGHEVTIVVFGLEWQAVVYFAEADAFSLNVLGRIGFLDRLKVGIVDYEQLLYLGLYDEP